MNLSGCLCEFHATPPREIYALPVFSDGLPVCAGVGDGGVARVERGLGERHFVKLENTAVKLCLLIALLRDSHSLYYFVK